MEQFGEKSEKPIRLNPEEFGLPPQRGDYMGIIANSAQMYRGAASLSKNRPLWIRIVAIFLGCLFLLGGIAEAAIAFWAILSSVTATTILVSILPISLCILLSGVGVKIISANVMKAK